MHTNPSNVLRTDTSETDGTLHVDGAAQPKPSRAPFGLTPYQRWQWGKRWFAASRTWLRALLYLFAAAALLLTVSTPLGASAQWLFTAAMLVLVLFFVRSPGHLATLGLLFTATLFTGRYFYWRLTESVIFEWGWDIFITVALLGAELYTLSLILLSYFISLWPLHRPPVSLSGDNQTWPSVDVLIPTYNEPLEVVRPTLIAAQNLLWPKDKLQVYLLDDGHREVFRDLCEELGVRYLTRNDNRHAKAGNINAALAHSEGELIAVFDCDFRPTRNFLLETVGWFQRQPRLFLVQTPHYFFFPDPLDRNLGIYRKVPQEGDIFYGAIQDGKDFWNASFFCGSAAVLRRAALDEVGGLAVETVTEDAHTAHKLHRLGWHSAYINRRLSAGYSTETLAGLIGQRIRWARGTIQILRIEGLWAKGLSAAQNLSYLAGYLFYLHGLPRIVFYLAPPAFLILGMQAIHAPGAVIAAYVLPYLFITQLASWRLYGRYRHAFWGDIFETVTSWYVLKPTLLALINPKLGKFNVTPKGACLERGFFDLGIAKPFLFFLSLAWIAMIFGVWQLHIGAGDWAGAIVVNMAWNGYNIVILSVALAAAWERPQRRASPRVGQHNLPVTLEINGQRLRAHTVDASMTGLRVVLDANQTPPPWQHGERIIVHFSDTHPPPGLANCTAPPAVALHARLLQTQDDSLSLALLPLSLAQERWLNWNLFGRPDAWEQTGYTPDNMVDSLATVMRIALRFYVDLLREAFKQIAQTKRARRV